MLILNREERLQSLESAVKRILAQTGDDHCWRDWRGDYENLADLVGAEFKPVVLDRATHLKNCEHFIDCLLSKEHYIAPSVAENARLRKELATAERRADWYLTEWTDTKIDYLQEKKGLGLDAASSLAEERIGRAIESWEVFVAAETETKGAERSEP